MSNYMKFIPVSSDQLFKSLLLDISVILMDGV